MTNFENVTSSQNELQKLLCFALKCPPDGKARLNCNAECSLCWSMWMNAPCALRGRECDEYPSMHQKSTPSEKTTLTIKFKKLSDTAIAPYKGSVGAAGYDLTATEVAVDEIDPDIYTYKTDIAIEIPPGFVGLIFPRSSIYKTGMTLCNGVGVIDSDYRGEITFKMRILAGFPNSYRPGDRIGQLVVMPIPQINFVEVDSLSETQRGQGGYGSTGK